MRSILLTIMAIACLAGVAPASAGEGFVEANGAKFHYIDEGEGPPLLLLHGGSETLDSWRTLIPQASRKYHVFAYDTRGHGGSTGGNRPFTYNLLASDAAAVIGALHLEHPLVMGYSDGGTTALLLAIQHPDLPRAVIVGGATNVVAGSPHYFAGLRAFFGVGRKGSITDAELAALAKAQPDTAQFYEQAHRRDGNPTYWRSLLKQLWPMWTTPMTIGADRLHRVKAPVMVLLADHDEFSTVREAVDMQEHLRDGQLAVLPGTKHDVFMQSPDLFNTIVLGFLDSHAKP